MWFCAYACVPSLHPWVNDHPTAPCIKSASHHTTLIWSHHIMQLRQISYWALGAPALIWYKHSLDYLKQSFRYGWSNLAQLQKCVRVNRFIILICHEAETEERSRRLNGCELILMMELVEYFTTVMDGNLCLCLCWVSFFIKVRMSEAKVETVSKQLAAHRGMFKHNTLPHKCFQGNSRPSESDVYLCRILSQAMDVWVW